MPSHMGAGRNLSVTQTRLKRVDSTTKQDRNPNHKYDCNHA